MLPQAFLACARKALRALQGIASKMHQLHLQEWRIQFNNTLVNKTMLDAIRYFEDQTEAQGIALLFHMQAYGQDVLAASYTKRTAQAGSTASSCQPWHW
jgi:hypothetical protein